MSKFYRVNNQSATFAITMTLSLSLLTKVVQSLFGAPTSTKRFIAKYLIIHHQKIVKGTINSFISDGSLHQTASNLIHPTPRTSHIYFLPKIHKVNNPGRPTVSACSCPTEVISIYLYSVMLS